MRTRETCKKSNRELIPRLNPRFKRIVKQPLITNTEDFGEAKRLMERTIPDPSPENVCPVCTLKFHMPFECPWRNGQLPEGAVPGPDYDVVCLGCGRIGETTCCPGHGAYIVYKSCMFCSKPGHWYWEDRCPAPDTTRPRYQMLASFKQALKEIPSSDLQISMQNKGESAVWLDFGKQNKNKDVILVGNEDADNVADKPEPSDLSEHLKMVESNDFKVPKYVTNIYPKYVVSDNLVRLIKEQNMVHLRSMDLKDLKHSDMVGYAKELVS